MRDLQRHRRKKEGPANRNPLTTVSGRAARNAIPYPRNESRMPAATAEPTTPATLGPMACISRKLPGLYFWPTIWDTRAAIGTADTPVVIVFIGWRLGGQVGIGTIVAAVGVGSLFNLNFALLRFNPALLHQENLPETLQRFRGRKTIT